MLENSSNCSVLEISPPTFSDVLSVYILVGLLSITANLIILASMALSKHQRDKYYLVVALSISDMTVGFACFAGGSVRLIMRHLQYDNIMVRPISCMLFPFEWYCHLAQALAGLITIVISIDRYFSVSQPILYFQGFFTVPIKAAVVVPYLLFCIALALAYVTSYLDSDQCVSIMCTATDSVGPLFTNASAIVGFSSFFIAAALCLRTLTIILKSRKIAESLGGSSDGDHKRNAKVTRTMVTIITSGLFLSFLPAFTVFINSALNGGSTTFNRVNASICLLYGINSASNFVIYCITNDEMRLIFSEFLLRKSIVTNVK